MNTVLILLSAAGVACGVAGAINADPRFLGVGVVCVSAAFLVPLVSR